MVRAIISPLPASVQNSSDQGMGQQRSEDFAGFQQFPRPKVVDQKNRPPAEQWNSNGRPVPRCSRILPAIFLEIIGIWHDLAALATEKMQIFPAGMLFQEWTD